MFAQHKLQSVLLPPQSSGVVHVPHAFVGASWTQYGPPGVGPGAGGLPPIHFCAFALNVVPYLTPRPRPLGGGRTNSKTKHESGSARLVEVFELNIMDFRTA